ncbi:MAG: NAD-dependent epimerase/dehydratase family protein [Bacteroidota bacterium]|nr:NAD-dependent epimerase/dehydratase family protein [Bacteroidota bacterium]
MNVQTILGAGGAIGKALAKELPAYTHTIRLVSRHPQKVNDDDELFTADLLDSQQVMQAVAGSEVVYLTAGLQYSTKIWQAQWPVIMRNTIGACIAAKSRLVFFDNIYMYDPNHLNPMTESTPIAPGSEKGKVRAAIVDMLMTAVKEKGLQALVARSADFYGFSIANVSMLTETVIKPLSEKKTANWFMDANRLHSFTWVPDAAKATAMLGNTPDAFGETWHLPTAAHPLTGKQWVELMAGLLNVQPKYRVVGKTLTHIMGWFMPIMREMAEMLYQYDRDYVFDSSKFERRFNYTPVGYEEGARMIAENDYGRLKV